MRYFKHEKSGKVFAIPEGKNLHIHFDWLEITQTEYDVLHLQKSKPVESAEFVKITKERFDYIMERFIEIDVESIRPLRAIATNGDVLGDHQRLKALNEERNKLMLELKHGQLKPE